MPVPPNKYMSKITLPVIFGPTGVGKTELAIEVALKINAEIVSCDSCQIYKYMDIGTSKPTKEQLAKVKHWFISLITPDTPYNAWMYAKEARQTIKEIVNRGKIPLVVGGSGLYLRALIDGFFEIPTIKDELSTMNSQEPYDELMQVDRATALKLHPNDRVRILRALEVYKATGMPMSSLKAKRVPFNCEPIYIGLTMEKDALYKRIEKRVEQMIENGFVEEVQKILAKGYSPELTSLQTIGYKELIEYLSGKLSLEKAIELIKRDTRRYAKRQFTWFKSIQGVQWLKMPSDTAVKKCILLFLKCNNSVVA